MARNTDKVELKDDQNLVKRVEELERVVKALLKGVKELENDTDEEYMPEGKYYEIDFK